MTNDLSVTHWIQGLKSDSSTAAQKIYEHYIHRLVAAAGRKLGRSSRRVEDEEDVAQIALNSFFRGVRAKRYPKLEDRHDLWQILMMLTERKATNQIRRSTAGKRGGGRTVGESILAASPDASRAGSPLDRFAGAEPTPEFAAMVSEEFNHLLEKLGDERLQQIALWKMEGWTNEEIARQLDCVTRTVERKLELIRSIWQAEE